MDRFVGTPAFASPEQFEHSALDVRSDSTRWAKRSGSRLAEKTPFAGHTLSEIHRAQESNRLPIEQFKGAHVPHRLKSLLESMLRIRTGLAPRHPRVSSASAALLPGGTQRATHARRSRSRNAIVFGVSTLFLAYRSRVENAASNPAADKSIAVLPFENLSPDPENVYFADGVQDEILTRLAKPRRSESDQPHLRDAIREQSRARLRKIGHQLGVARVVEGSVQRAGNRVRVNAQLIDVSTNRTLWGQTYDRDVADVFAIQSEIATSIARNCRPAFQRAKKLRLSRPPQMTSPRSNSTLGPKIFLRTRMQNEFARSG